MPDTRDLAAELRNFEESSRFLNPSPGEIPSLRGVDIHGNIMALGDSIGGDHIIYIDFKKRFDLDRRIRDAEKAGQATLVENLKRNKRRAGIVVVDVSGHQITDALIAAMFHQAFLLGVRYELDMFGEITTKIFEHLNTRFHRTSSINKYFTMIYGEIWESGAFRFISAAHPLPRIFSRRTGRFEELRQDPVTFPPVGILPTGGDMEDQQPERFGHYKKRYEVNELEPLQPGDVLLLCSDGLPEHGGDGFFPGEVEALLRESPEASAQETCQELRRRILAFAPPTDDISYVIAKKK